MCLHVIKLGKIPFVSELSPELTSRTYLEGLLMSVSRNAVAKTADPSHAAPDPEDETLFEMLAAKQKMPPLTVLLSSRSRQRLQVRSRGRMSASTCSHIMGRVKAVGVSTFVKQPWGKMWAAAMPLLELQLPSASTRVLCCELSCKRASGSRPTKLLW